MGYKHRFQDEWLVGLALKLPGVTAGTVESFRQESRSSLARALIQGGLSTEEALGWAVKAAYGIEAADTSDGSIDKLAIALVPEPVCQKHCLVPLRLKGDSIELAMANPLDMDAQSDVQVVSGRSPIPCYCPVERVEKLIAFHYSAETVVFDLIDRLDIHEAVEVVKEGKQEPAAEANVEVPIIQLANAIIAKAVRMRASDIHIEHDEKESHVRYRIDGMLKHVMVLPRRIAVGPIVSRIKIMAGLDIAEHRRPQDGRAKLRVGAGEVGLRVSILPTSFGEKVVMRILDNRAAEIPFKELDRLGQDHDALFPHQQA